MVEFNAENWPLNVQVAFEEWATIDCVRIVTYLISRKGKPAYSTRGMAEILNSTQKTISRAINLLVQHGYIAKFGNCYFLNSGIVDDIESESKMTQLSHEETTGESKMTQIRVKNDSESESKMTHNNNKQIKINNNNKKTATPTLVFPDWINSNPDLPKSLLDWITQRQNRKQPVSQIALNRIFKRYHEQPERFYAALEHSIEKDYRGVFDPPANTATTTTKKQTNVEATNEATAAFMRRMEAAGNGI